MFFLLKLLIILVGFTGLSIMPYLSLISLGYAFSQEPKEKKTGAHTTFAHLVNFYSTLPLIQDSSTLISKIQARYQSIQSFTADYHRKSIFVSTSQEVVRTVEGDGHLFWSRPLLLKLEQEKPQNEQIIVRDNQVWWIRPERVRVDLYPLDHFTNELRSLLDIFDGLTNVNKDFIIEYPVADEDIESKEELTLILRPKTPRMDIKQLALYFNYHDLLIKGFRITNLLGDVTIYNFLKTQINPNLSIDIYTYIPPNNYQVIDHRFQHSQ